MKSLEYNRSMNYSMTLINHTLAKNDQILLLLNVVSPSCQSISIMNCESYYILHTFDFHFFYA